MDLSRPVLERALFHVDNAYSIDAVRAVGRYRMRWLSSASASRVSHAARFARRLCKTNLPSNTAFRGFGGPQGLMVAEAYMEQLAKATAPSIRSVALRARRITKRPFASGGRLSAALSEGLRPGLCMGAHREWAL